MKTIKQDELFQSLGDFLKLKGVELKGGAYAHRVRQGCNLLTDLINGTQKTVRQAKVEVDKKLDQLRQSIHEATAPKGAPAASAPGPAPAAAAKSKRSRPARQRSSASKKSR
jgi:ribosome-associated protein YbcJ (S4-like RNA binding protein)